MKQLGVRLSKQSKRPAAHAPVATPSPGTTSIARGVSSSKAVDGDGKWFVEFTYVGVKSPAVVILVNCARVDPGFDIDAAGLDCVTSGGGGRTCGRDSKLKSDGNCEWIGEVGVFGPM